MRMMFGSYPNTLGTPQEPSSPDYDSHAYLWGLGSVVSAFNAIVQNTDNVDFRMTYESRLKETLLKYYNTTKEPMCFGCFVNPHDQRLYDDAIWVGIDLADLYSKTKDSWYLDYAKSVWNFVLSGKDDELGGGVYWDENAKDSKNEAYSESDPYSCFRDPRFYASIYYHGSKRYTRWSFAEGEYAVNTFRAREIDCSQTDPWTGSDLKASTTNKRQRTRTGYYSRKYLNPTKNPTSPRNDAPGFKHFRFAEIILNYAEAAAEAGHTSDALEALKEIRDRVAMPHITTTDQAALIREIRAERRIELFFEEHRFFDIRRWQQPDGNLEDILHYTTAMQIDEQPNGTYTYQRIKIRDNGYACYTNKFLFLPLPLAEASRLESITGMNWQNPGW